MITLPKTWRGAEMSKYQQGMSLIELMVSITIGLILLAGMTTLFINQNNTHKSLDKSARMIENGRFAMQTLADDLQVAGFYGELNPITFAVPAALPDPCDTEPVDLKDTLRLHVQGVDNVVAATKPTCIIEDVKNGTDIIVIRRASTASQVVPPAGNLTRFLQVSRCQTQGENSFELDYDPANMTKLARDCAALADVRRFMVRIYYIAANNNASDGIPTLKRLELSETGAFAVEALVEGIENLQFEYGLDTGPVNGVADSFGDCDACTPSQFADAVDVRIHLLSRSRDTFAGYEDTNTYTLGSQNVDPPAGDAYKRRVYSQFVRLVNFAGRRD